MNSKIAQLTTGFLLTTATVVCAGTPATEPPFMAAAAPASPWEISVGAAAGELNLDWDFKSAFGYDTNPLQEELSDTFLAPAVDLRYSILDSDSFTLRLGLGYSYAEADWQTGEHDAGEIGEEPNEFYAIDIASASLSLHRIAAYVDLAWKRDAVELGLRTGPTLNIFDASFEGSHENFQHVNPGELGRYRSGEVTSESATEAVFGASAEIFARYTLPNTRIFIEVSGGYNWTDSLDLGSSTVGAKLDATSWRAGVALGIKF